MKTTAMGVILELTETQQAYLDNLMARYCAAVRWSFKRLLEGKGIQDIRQGVQVKFNLNSRQANDAVYDAQSTIKSQYELVKLHCENARAKIEFTQKRIAKAKSSKKKPTCKNGWRKNKESCHIGKNTWKLRPFRQLFSAARNCFWKDVRVISPGKSGRKQEATVTCPGETRPRAAT